MIRTWRDHEPSQQQFYPPIAHSGAALKTKPTESVWIIINPLVAIMNPLDCCFVIFDVAAIHGDDDEVLRAGLETR
jgi:hypothetical protein